ncbi:DUF5085 domain-containing protein, partial [Staphylococcus aureus]
FGGTAFEIYAQVDLDESEVYG